MTQSPAPKKIDPADLVCLDDYTARHPIRVDTVYAKAAHKDNIFKAAIYRPDARMWCHRELLPVILRAADLCHARTGYYFELKDCLRTLEAQQLIIDSAIVRANPAWLEEPRLFSPPGKGGHPRGMAIDIILVDRNGSEIDMGTPFDYMTSDKSVNPAARDFADFGKGRAHSDAVRENRKILEDAMMQAALACGVEIVPLPQEWWDFRFPNSYSSRFAPISDKELPAHMRMTDLSGFSAA